MYSQHSGKKNIDLDDVKLSVSMNTEQTFTSPPPREALLELARVKNAAQVNTVLQIKQNKRRRENCSATEKIIPAKASLSLLLNLLDCHLIGQCS